MNTATRSRNGEGSVRQVRAEPELWQLRYRTHDAQGRYVRKSAYAPTEREARAKLRAALAARDAGDVPETAHYTLRSWIAAYLEARPNMKPVRESTMQSYRRLGKHWQRDRIGSMQLVKLRAEHVADAMGRLEAAGLGPSSRRIALIFLRMVLKAAQASGHVRRNVASSVGLPAEPELRDIPARGEMARLWRAIDASPDRAFWSLLGKAGLRIGEAAALRWRDLSDAGVLTVSRTLYTRGRTGLPKGDKPRTLYLHPDILEAIGEHIARTYGAGVIPHPSSPMFPLAADPGLPLGVRGWYKRWADILEAAGLPAKAYTPHTLRHITAHVLIPMFGLERTSRYLGHADTRITDRYYGHVTSTDIRFESPAVAPHRSPKHG